MHGTCTRNPFTFADNEKEVIQSDDKEENKILDGVLACSEQSPIEIFSQPSSCIMIKSVDGQVHTMTTNNE